MIQANINDRYAQLSQQEKAELIGIYTRAGYRDLASIIAHYNSCGGKLHASGGPVTNTARYRDDSYLYNPPVNVGAPIEVPLRYRPLPDYGDYQLQTTRGMIEEMPIDLNIEIPERGYGVLLPEQPVAVPALDARQDAARRIMAVENSKNNVNGGYDAKTGRWYPHKSHEGGADTIAYGIKLSNGTPEAKLALQQGYLTDEQAVSAVDTLVQKYYDAAKKVYDGKYGAGEWDKLSDKSQSILVDYSYNPGLSKFPSLMEGFHSGDMDMIRKHYKRYSGGKELGRNKVLLQDLDDLENNYSIFRANGGKLPIVNPKVVGNVLRTAVHSIIPQKVAKGLAGIANLSYGALLTPKEIADYYNYGVQEDWNPAMGFLMSPSGQKDYMESIGYHLVDDGNYGMVNRAASELSKSRGEKIPIYQLGEDEIDPNQVELISTDQKFINEYYQRMPQDKMLRDAGSYPIALYKDKNSDDLYIKQWDLNDYGQHGKIEKKTDRFSGSTTYGARQFLAELYDSIGRPFVQRTGLVKLLSEDEGYNQEYGDAANFHSSGGKIHIKPENRGKFTALKKRTGHSASWFKEHGTPAQKKMATFALNARKWKHEDGGLLQEFHDISSLF